MRDPSSVRVDGAGQDETSTGWPWALVLILAGLLALLGWTWWRDRAAGRVAERVSVALEGRSRRGGTRTHATRAPLDVDETDSNVARLALALKVADFVPPMTEALLGDSSFLKVRSLIREVVASRHDGDSHRRVAGSCGELGRAWGSAHPDPCEPEWALHEARRTAEALAAQAQALGACRAERERARGE